MTHDFSSGEFRDCWWLRGQELSRGLEDGLQKVDDALGALGEHSLVAKEMLSHRLGKIKEISFITALTLACLIGTSDIVSTPPQITTSPAPDII